MSVALVSFFFLWCPVSFRAMHMYRLSYVTVFRRAAAFRGVADCADRAELSGKWDRLPCRRLNEASYVTALSYPSQVQNARRLRI